MLCTRTVEPARRWEVLLCVPIATLFEVYGSLIWGGYTYQLHNIPLYVPPGHALVYVFGITAVALPLVRAHGRLFRHGVLAVATAWMVAGVTVLPLVTHRWDVQGALLWPLLVWCILRSGRGEMFAAIWIATATIEIAGTVAGCWGWAAIAPGRTCRPPTRRRRSPQATRSSTARSRYWLPSLQWRSPGSGRPLEVGPRGLDQPGEQAA